MIFPTNKTAWELEWNQLLRQEEAFLKKRMKKQDSFLNQKLDGKVPEKLQTTLEKAFCTAFETVFEKGTSVIEKTFNREKLEYEHKVNQYSVKLKENRKNLKAFSKAASKAGTKNVLLSGVFGVGLGVLGIGIPDIVLFTGMMLKNIYEIAIDYGFDYSSEEERYFILLLIQGSVSYQDEILTINKQLDAFDSNPVLPEGYDRKRQIQQTAKALSKEFLYMKFLQGVPVIGAIGGTYDAIYMQRVTGYAKLKYKRRFLFKS